MTEAQTTATILTKTASGTGWVIGWRMATRVLGLVNTLILVRLLLPADFGLVALGASFASGIDALALIGIEDAILRHPNPTRAVYDTGFTLGLIRSLATATIAAALAWPAAIFFKEPRMAAVVLVLAAGIVIDGCANIGIVQFRRDFAFSKEFYLNVLPRMVGIGVTVGAALLLRSYWALLIGLTANRVLRTVGSYLMHPHRPRLTLSAWHGLVGYSAWNWAIGLAVMVRDRCDSILIGRTMDTAHVGVFSLGQELALMPTSELTAPLARAAFSGFIAARQAALAPGDLWLRIIASAGLVTLPAGLGVSLVAAPAVKLAFGPEWGGAIPVVQIFALIGCFSALGGLGSALFSVHGFMRLSFKVTVCTIVVRVALLLALLPHWGLPGGALAVAGAVAFEQATFVVLLTRRFGVSFASIGRHLWRPSVATAAMTAALLATGLGWQPSFAADTGGRLLELGKAIGLGAPVYVLVLLAAWLLSGRPQGAETDLLTLVRRAGGRLVGRGK